MSWRIWRCVAFAVASAPVLWISRGSLRRPDAHGFYRFFAFEAILGLVALGLPSWYRDARSPRQLASWSLLLASAPLAVHGFYLLRQMGKPDPSIADPALLGLEKTTRLVRTGAYRYIRHPLYSSLLLFAWGANLKAPSWISTMLTAIATTSLYLTARVEERENALTFGDEYAEYVRVTRMFVPFVF